MEHLGVNMKRWATRELRSGDLTALKGVARGACNPENGQFDRLLKRGFLKKRTDGTPKLTIPGRLALVVKAIGEH